MNHAKRASTFLASIALAASLGGCEDDFDPGSRVTGFRVLAVGTDNSYARPGEGVRLSSLSYDPQMRPVTWGWAACVNPDASSVEGCLENISEQAANGGNPLLAFGQGVDALDYTIPLDALSSIGPEARPLAMVGIASIACPGELSLPTASRPDFRCAEFGSGRELGLDEYVVGVKRVFVRESDRNQNPIISRITFDGADWAAEEIKEVGACDTEGNVYEDCPGSLRHHVAIVPTPESFEQGVDEFGQDYSEHLVSQYYATEGIFEYESRIAEDPGTGWVARKRASGQELRMWFVLRDDRGGVSWTERRVRVR
ncbi:MAG TPA: hypothetical protein VIM73_18650 [Polyangiaceae bacterium]